MNQAFHLDWLARVISPPPRFRISEWAESEFVLPAEGNAEPGKYHCARMPWQRDMLDDPLNPEVAETVWMIASQLGKTLCLIIIIGYFIAHRPRKILVVYPKIDDGKDWLRDKALPAFEVTASLTGKIKDPRERGSESRGLNRKFTGGGLTVVGSISTSSLRRLSAGVVIQDEIDDFETTPQGDSMALADKRAETFHDAVKLKSSTPTHKGSSRVESKFEASDKQYFFVPCPFCGHMQHLRWEQFKFTFTKNGEQYRNTEDARYECENETCKEQWRDQDRIAAIYDPRAQWRATVPFNRIRGRHLNGLYRVIGRKSAYKNYHHEFAEAFLEAQKGGRETLMVWVNTFLANTWQDPADELDWHPLMSRAEDYSIDDIPTEVCLLTCTMDVQKDYVDVSLFGTGEDEEVWWLEKKQIVGNFDLPSTQEAVDDYLNRTFLHPSGTVLKIAACAIDTAYQTKSVYRFCAKRVARRVFAVRGSSTANMPLITKSTKRHYGITLYVVGTDTAKDLIYSRLKLDEPGPRYIHFPKAERTKDGRKISTGFNEKFYKELCSEKIVNTFEKGRVKREYVKTQARNEALDEIVYKLALDDLLNVTARSIDRIKAAMGGKEYTLDPEKKMPTEPKAEKPQIMKRPVRPKTELPPKFGGGFFNPLGI